MGVIRRGSVAVAIAAVALPLAFAACGSSNNASGSSSGSGSSGSGSQPTVRLQALSGGLSAVAIKAMELQGFDKKNGFHGEFQYVNPDASTQNFLLGKSDVDFDSGPPDMAIAANAKQKYDVVSFSGEAKNHVSVIAPAKSPYTDMQSLKGKKIGWFGSDSTAAIEISILLKNEGIDFFKDYQFAQADPAALVPLLKSGQVDAIVDFQPYVSWAQSQVPGGVKTILDPAALWQKTHPGGDLWTTIVSTKRSWLNAHPDLANHVEKAWCQTADYLDKNMDQVVKQPEIVKLLDPVPASALQQMATFVKDKQLFACGWSSAQVKNVNAFLDAMAQQGTLFKKNPGNLFKPLPSAGS